MHDHVVEARVIEKMLSWTPAPNADGGDLFPPDCLTLVLREMTPQEKRELKNRLLARSRWMVGTPHEPSARPAAVPFKRPSQANRYDNNTSEE